MYTIINVYKTFNFHFAIQFYIYIIGTLTYAVDVQMYVCILTRTLLFIFLFSFLQCMLTRGHFPTLTKHAYRCKYPRCLGKSQSIFHTNLIFLKDTFYCDTICCFKFMYILPSFSLCLFYVLFMLIYTNYCHTCDFLIINTQTKWRPTICIMTCSLNVLDNG